MLLMEAPTGAPAAASSASLPVSWTCPAFMPALPLPPLILKKDKWLLGFAGRQIWGATCESMVAR
eukprot:12048953-Prorocentrum_lima.AAC.1